MTADGSPDFPTTSAARDADRSRNLRSVLFMTHALDLSGVATHMSVLGRQLMSRGIRVGIVARVTTGKTHNRESFEKLGFQIFQAEFPMYGLTFRNARNFLRSRQQLRQIAADFDVLHVHAPTLCAIARMTGKPYVTTFNISVDGKKKRRIARCATKLFPTAFGQTAIAISDELKTEMHEALGIPLDHLAKATYGVDGDAFSPASPREKSAARRKFGLADEHFVVGMIAILDERKNHQLLIDAVDLVKDRLPYLRVLFGGSGSSQFTDRLQSQINQRGLSDRIKLLGHVRALDVYHASDVAALTSFREGFPLTIVEAMLCGLPIVRTPVEGAREQVEEGVSGYLVPLDQPSLLAERLVTLANDSSLRLTMGEAGLLKARKDFSAESMANQIIHYYEHAMKARR